MRRATAESNHTTPVYDSSSTPASDPQPFDGTPANADAFSGGNGGEFNGGGASGDF
jgi:hypothetical protein